MDSKTCLFIIQFAISLIASEPVRYWGPCVQIQPRQGHLEIEPNRISTNSTHMYIYTHVCVCIYTHVYHCVNYAFCERVWKQNCHKAKHSVWINRVRFCRQHTKFQILLRIASASAASSLWGRDSLGRGRIKSRRYRLTTCKATGQELLCSQFC